MFANNSPPTPHTFPHSATPFAFPFRDFSREAIYHLLGYVQHDSSIFDSMESSQQTSEKWRYARRKRSLIRNACSFAAQEGTDHWDGFTSVDDGSDGGDKNDGRKRLSTVEEGDGTAELAKLATAGAEVARLIGSQGVKGVRRHVFSAVANTAGFVAVPR